MSTPTSVLDHSPRIRALPGPSRLVRINEDAWVALRSQIRPLDPSAGQSAPMTSAQSAELSRAGLLVGDEIEPHWREALALALSSPVTVSLVCVDGTSAWTSQLLVGGAVVVVVDQVREVSATSETMHLGRRSSAITLGLSDLGWLSATVEALIPQRPAFVPSLPAREAGDAEAEPVDAPAVAEVQVLMTSADVDGAPPIRGRSWYALGDGGEVLATTVGTGDDARVEPAPSGALAAGVMGDLLTAIRQAGTAFHSMDIETGVER